MPAVSFNYWEIDDSIKKAKKTESYLSDYIGDMKSVPYWFGFLRICEPLDGIDQQENFKSQ